jgi:hypothetical protein
MRTVILAIAAASLSVIGALASLPPAEELTQGDFVWPDQDDGHLEPLPLCSLPPAQPDIAMQDVLIMKSGRLQPSPPVQP